MRLGSTPTRAYATSEPKTRKKPAASKKTVSEKHRPLPEWKPEYKTIDINGKKFVIDSKGKKVSRNSYALRKPVYKDDGSPALGTINQEGIFVLDPTITRIAVTQNSYNQIRTKTKKNNMNEENFRDNETDTSEHPNKRRKITQTQEASPEPQPINVNNSNVTTRIIQTDLISAPLVDDMTYVPLAGEKAEETGMLYRSRPLR